MSRSKYEDKFYIYDNCELVLYPFTTILNWYNFSFDSYIPNQTSVGARGNDNDKISMH